MKTLITLLVLCALQSVPQVYTQSSDPSGCYTIVASNPLVPYVDYKVFISWDLPNPANLVVKLFGTDVSNAVQYDDAQTVTVGPFSDTTLVFHVTSLENLNYQLSVVGDGINETTALNFNPKSYSAFIQTDKSVYKAKDLLRFRVFMVDKATNLLKVNSPFQVRLKDPNGSQLQTWVNVTAPKGVFKASSKISKMPVLGTHLLEVDYDGQTTTKAFEVREYKLPRFEVTLTGQPSGNEVVVKVVAKYTFGKSVVGIATVTATGVGDKKVQKVVDITGSAQAEFTLTELGITNNFVNYVQLAVDVLDTASGLVQSASGSVIVGQAAHNIQFLDYGKFKNGLPFTFKVAVTKFDGSPVTDTRPVLRLEVNYGIGASLVRTYRVGQSGIVPVTLSIPKEAKQLWLRAIYRTTVVENNYITQATSASQSFIRAALVTANPQQGDKLTIRVDTTEKVSKFFYSVVGRGGIVTSGQVNGRKTFEVCTNYLMVPNFYVTVWYTRADGEVVSDALLVQLPANLRNKVTINLSQNLTQPGENVTLSIETAKNSYLALSAVDLSVKLLGQDNDITKDLVFADLELYKWSGGGPVFFNAREGFGRIMPFNYGDTNDFVKSGLAVITNGTLPPLYYPFFFNEAFIRRDGAAESGATPGSAPTDVVIRKDFPETWIWDDIPDVECGKVTRTYKVPETITSYVITGVAQNLQCGFGLTEPPSKLTIFREFFVVADVPPSVVRNEEVCIVATVYNFGPADVPAEVTLFGTDGLEFRDFDAGENWRQNVQVPTQNGSPVSFCVTPRKAGQLPLKFTATSPNAGDGILLYLNVKSEGKVTYINKAVLLDLRTTSQYSQSVQCDLPADFIEGSEEVTVSCVGDVLGPTLSNLDELIRTPSGCGEQTLILLTPNLVAYDYLTAVNKLDATLKKKILDNILEGYKNQLNYRRTDNSFSAFGNSDQVGSTWLTAFTLQAFFGAAKVGVAVDTLVVEGAINFLIGVQKPDGSFVENGNVIHKDMQGAAGQGVALTAFVVLTLLQAPNPGQYTTNTDKAVAYIKSKLNAASSPYDLAICGYALALYSDPVKTNVLGWLNAQVKTSGDLQYWENPSGAYAIEITGYGTLFRILMNDPNYAANAKYLLSKRNSLGSYGSTQDTIMSLKALTEYAKKLLSPNLNMVVTATSNENSPVQWTVNPSNALIVQKQDLAPQTRRVDVTATGVGVALFQMECKFNVPVVPLPESFELSATVLKPLAPTAYTLKVCARYKLSGVTNMALVEVYFLSGYVFDSDKKPVGPGLKKFESLNGGTRVAIYLDNVGATELCFTVSATRLFEVQGLKKAYVEVKDYYDQTKVGQTSYDLN